MKAEKLDPDDTKSMRTVMDRLMSYSINSKIKNKK